MDIVSGYAQLTQDIVNFTGMSRPMLHMHAGMAIYLLTQFLVRDRRASLVALALVAEIELGNELMNRLHKGYWDWGDTAADIALTLFWPVMCYAVGKYRRWRWEHLSGLPAGQPSRSTAG
jgi:membrane protein YdbS with pleckstrin-like domain